MDKIKFESPDMVAKNIDRIAALFPNCVTEMLDAERSTAEHKVYKKAMLLTANTVSTVSFKSTRSAKAILIF